MTSYRKSPWEGKLASLPSPYCNQDEYINISKNGLFKKTKTKKIQNTDIMYPVFLPRGSKFRNKKQNKNMQKYSQLLEIKKIKSVPQTLLDQRELNIMYWRRLTQWTSVWANPRRWWKSGKPGMLQFMGSQRVGRDLVIEQQ